MTQSIVYYAHILGLRLVNASGRPTLMSGSMCKEHNIISVTLEMGIITHFEIET